MLITRPNELSTTSALLPCAIRATGNASDDSLVIPVTRIRLPSSSMCGISSSLRAVCSSDGARLVLALGRQRSSAAW
jgi:hypothetical protein